MKTGDLRARPALVLVHSFPTNSILLAGLAQFLERYFVVHFVDLPGFVRAVPPLPRPSLAGYARHVEQRIESLGLDRYLLGGISFGYLIVTLMTLDARCRAVLAMEPFLGTRSLYMGPWKRRLFALLTRAIVWLGLSNRLFRSQYWARRMRRRGAPDSRIETVQREIDPRTFFATATQLVTHDRPTRFPDRPHVLLVNPEDATINAEDVTQVFQTSVAPLLVVETTVDHYPISVTPEYFEANIPADDIARIEHFLGEATDLYEALAATPAASGAVDAG